MRVPQAVQPGDRVRLVGAAHCPNPAAVDHAVEVLTRWGLTVEAGEDAPDHWTRSAWTDEQHLAHINSTLRDPGIRAVITVPDDSIAYRIADRLDFDAARRDPKPVVGIGGTTHLHLALWRECGLVGLYGSLPGEPETAGEDTERAAEAMRRALMTTEPIVLSSQPGEISAAVTVPGRATGILVGGNLSAVRSTIGLGLPSLDGAILLLDDSRTIGLGQVDRQLTHLRRARALDGVAGIVLGRFTGFDDYVDRGWRLADVLKDQLTRLGVPVLGGVRLGNGPGSLTAPIGTTATLDTDAATLTIDPGVR